MTRLRLLRACLAAALACSTCSAAEGSRPPSSESPARVPVVPSAFFTATPAPTGYSDSPVRVNSSDFLVTVVVGGVAEFVVPYSPAESWSVSTSDSSVVEVSRAVAGGLPRARGVAEGSADVYLVGPDGAELGFIVTVVAVP